MSVHNSVTANSGLQVNSCVRHLRATADLNKAMQNTVSLTVIVHCFDILMIINNKKAGAAGEYFKPAITSDYCYIIHELFFTICSGLIVKIYITPVFLKKVIGEVIFVQLMDYLVGRICTAVLFVLSSRTNRDQV